MKEDAIAYCIDAADRLVSFNAGWTAFAERNGGEDARPEKVVGRSLWDFVADPTVQELYRRMVARARQGRVVRFRYRCDAPSERRVFQMEIRRRPQGRVEFSSGLISSDPRPHVAWLDRPESPGTELVRMCSWCARVALPDGRWVAIEQAIEQHRALQRLVPPSITHGICQNCQAEMLQLLRRGPAPNDELHRLPT